MATNIVFPTTSSIDDDETRLESLPESPVINNFDNNFDDNFVQNNENDEPLLDISNPLDVSTPIRSQKRQNSSGPTGFHLPSVSKFQKYSNLTVLVLLNACNWMDRMTIVPLLETFQKEFKVFDRDIGALQSAFIVTFMSLSMFFGYLADRTQRKRIIVIGIVIWQTFIICSSFLNPVEGNRYQQWIMLLVCRAMFGVGEAAYVNIAPAIIDDLFTSREGKIAGMTIFSMAMPVGAGVGYMLASNILASTGSWQWAIVSPCFLTIPVGVFYMMFVDEVKQPVDQAGRVMVKRGFLEDLAIISKRKSLRGIIGGMTFMAFAVTSCTNWISIFISRMIDIQGHTMEEAEMIKNNTMSTFGIITIVTGLLGGYFGGCFAAYLRKNYNYGRAESDIAAYASSLASINLFIFITVAGKSASLNVLLGLHFVTMMIGACVWPLVPLMIFSVVLPNQKSFANGLVSTVSHVFGDAFAPTLIGIFSDSICDRYPDDNSSKAPVHNFFCLYSAIFCLPIVLVFGSICFFYTGHFIERDTQINLEEAARSPGSRRSPNRSSMRSSSRQVLVSD